MKKLIAATILVLIAGIAPLTTATALPAHVRADLPRVAPPCINEDGSGQRACVWDGRKRGNGKGRSIIFRGDRATFVTHVRAHRTVKRWRDANCVRVGKKDHVCRGWRIVK